VTHHFLQIQTKTMKSLTVHSTFVLTYTWFSSCGLAVLVIRRSSNAQAPLFVWLFILRPAIKRSFCTIAAWSRGIVPKGLVHRIRILSDKMNIFQQSHFFLADQELLRGKPRHYFGSSVSNSTSEEVSSMLRPTHAGEGGFKRHLCHVQPYLQTYFGLKQVISVSATTVLQTQLKAPVTLQS
jgi:hypothetical protein